MKPYTERQMKVARAAAFVADALQIAVFPLFSEGFLSPANMALDCFVAALLTWLVGFHVAFLPSFLVEDVPVLNLAPTWTLAVLLATRKGATAIDATATVENPPPSLAPGSSQLPARR